MKERWVSGRDQDMVAAVQSVINTLLLHIKTMDGVDTAVSEYLQPSILLSETYATIIGYSFSRITAK